MRFFKRPETGTTPTVDIPDEWRVFEDEHEGKRLVARFNEGPKVVAGTRAYGIQIGVAIPFNAPDPEGMPADDEIRQLEEFEEALINRAGTRAIFTGAITTNGMREFVLYTGSSDWIEAFHDELRGLLPSHDVQVMAQKDPDWSVYRQFVADQDGTARD